MNDDWIQSLAPNCLRRRLYPKPPTRGVKGDVKAGRAKRAGEVREGKSFAAAERA